MSDGGDSMSMWGSIVKAASDLTLNTINNYEARKAASKANSYNIGMWNAQNAYNTPAHQMQLLKEAGLNPNLAYGNLASSAAGSTPRAEYATPQYQNIDLVGTYQDLRQKDATTENLKAQADSTRKNMGISEERLGMEEKRLKADLLNADNDAHLKGVQFGIMNNQLRESLERAEQARMRTLAMRATMPYDIVNKYKQQQIDSKMMLWRNYWQDVGAPISALSPFTNALGSHISWHRGEDF